MYQVKVNDYGELTITKITKKPLYCTDLVLWTLHQVRSELKRYGHEQSYINRVISDLRNKKIYSDKE